MALAEHLVERPRAQAFGQWRLRACAGLEQIVVSRACHDEGVSMPLRLSQRLALLPAVLLAASAQAARPLFTEDAAIIAAGGCEVETAANRVAPGAVPALRSASAQLACGVRAGTEVALALARQVGGDERKTVATLAGKSALNDPGEAGAAYAFAYGVIGAQDPQGSLRRALVYLNGVMSKTIGTAFTVHANLGWFRERADARGRASWALAAESPAAPRWDLVAEAFANERERNPWLQFGARWTLRPQRLIFDAAVGARGQERSATLGMTFAF
jgi:hypothetical protein